MWPMAKQSRWRVRKDIDEISRNYYFFSPGASHAAAILTIKCRLKRSVGDHFIRSILTLHLSPIKLRQETSFEMGLLTADQLEGGIVKARARPFEGERNTALLTLEYREDVQQCFNVISSGKDMLFSLGNGSQPDVKLLLPNDKEFGRLYKATLERLARTQHRTKAGLFLRRFNIDPLEASKTLKRSWQLALEAAKKLDVIQFASSMFRRLTAASFDRVGNDKEFGRLYKATLERLTRTQHRAGLFLRRFNIDPLDATKTLKRSWQLTLEAAKELYVIQFASSMFRRLTAASFDRVGYKSLKAIKFVAKHLRPQIWTRAAAPSPYDATKNDLMHLLREIDLLHSASPSQRSFLTAFKDGSRQLIQAASNMVLRLKAVTYGRIFPNKNDATDWLGPGRVREWLTLGACLLAGVVIAVSLMDSSTTQSTPNSKTVPAVAASLAVSARQISGLTMQAETSVYVVGLVNAANDELSKPDQLQAPAAVHQVTQAGPLSAGKREPPKSEQTPTSLRPTKTRPVKVSSAASRAAKTQQQTDDEQLKFLFDR